MKTTILEKIKAHKKFLWILASIIIVIALVVAGYFLIKHNQEKDARMRQAFQELQAQQVSQASTEFFTQFQENYKEPTAEEKKTQQENITAFFEASQQAQVTVTPEEQQAQQQELKKSSNEFFTASQDAFEQNYKDWKKEERSNY